MATIRESSASEATGMLYVGSVSTETVRPLIGSGILREADTRRSWLTGLAIEAADAALGTAHMRRYPGMTAGVLASRARRTIEDCYAEATEQSEFEIDRLEIAAEVAKKIASDMQVARSEG